MYMEMSRGWEGHPERDRLEGEARQALHRGLQLDPTNVAAWNRLGLMHMELQVG